MTDLNWNAPVTRSARTNLMIAIDQFNTNEIIRLVRAYPPILFENLRGERSSFGYTFLQKLIVKPNQDSLGTILSWLSYDQFRFNPFQYAVINHTYEESLPILIEKFEGNQELYLDMLSARDRSYRNATPLGMLIRKHLIDVYTEWEDGRDSEQEEEDQETDQLRLNLLDSYRDLVDFSSTVKGTQFISDSFRGFRNRYREEHPEGGDWTFDYRELNRSIVTIEEALVEWLAGDLLSIHFATLLTEIDNRGDDEQKEEEDWQPDECDPEEEYFKDNDDYYWDPFINCTDSGTTGGWIFCAAEGCPTYTTGQRLFPGDVVKGPNSDDYYEVISMQQYVYNGNDSYLVQIQLLRESINDLASFDESLLTFITRVKPKFKEGDNLIWRNYGGTLERVDVVAEPFWENQRWKYQVNVTNSNSRDYGQNVVSETELSIQDTETKEEEWVTGETPRSVTPPPDNVSRSLSAEIEDAVPKYAGTDQEIKKGDVVKFISSGWNPMDLHTVRSFQDNGELELFSIGVQGMSNVPIDAIAFVRNKFTYFVDGKEIRVGDVVEFEDDRYNKSKAEGYVSKIIPNEPGSNDRKIVIRYVLGNNFTSESMEATEEREFVYDLQPYLSIMDKHKVVLKKRGPVYYWGDDNEKQMRVGDIVYLNGSLSDATRKRNKKKVIGISENGRKITVRTRKYKEVNGEKVLEEASRESIHIMEDLGFLRRGFLYRTGEEVKKGDIVNFPAFSGDQELIEINETTNEASFMSSQGNFNNISRKTTMTIFKLKFVRRGNPYYQSSTVLNSEGIKVKYLDRVSFRVDQHTRHGVVTKIDSNNDDGDIRIQYYAPDKDAEDGKKVVTAWIESKSLTFIARVPKYRSGITVRKGDMVELIKEGQEWTGRWFRDMGYPQLRGSYFGLVNTKGIGMYDYKETREANLFRYDGYQEDSDGKKIREQFILDKKGPDSDGVIILEGEGREENGRKYKLDGTIDEEGKWTVIKTYRRDPRTIQYLHVADITARNNGVSFSYYENDSFRMPNMLQRVNLKRRVLLYNDNNYIKWGDEVEYEGKTYRVKGLTIPNRLQGKVTVYGRDDPIPVSKLGDTIYDYALRYPNLPNTDMMTDATLVKLYDRLSFLWEGTRVYGYIARGVTKDHPKKKYFSVKDEPVKVSRINQGKLLIKFRVPNEIEYIAREFFFDDMEQFMGMEKGGNERNSPYIIEDMKFRYEGRVIYYEEGEIVEMYDEVILLADPEEQYKIVDISGGKILTIQNTKDEIKQVTADNLQFVGRMSVRAEIAGNYSVATFLNDRFNIIPETKVHLHDPTFKPPPPDFSETPQNIKALLEEFNRLGMRDRFNRSGRSFTQTVELLTPATKKDFTKQYEMSYGCDTFDNRGDRIYPVKLVVGYSDDGKKPIYDGNKDGILFIFCAKELQKLLRSQRSRRKINPINRKEILEVVYITQKEADEQSVLLVREKQEQDAILKRMAEKKPKPMSMKDRMLEMQIKSLKNLIQTAQDKISGKEKLGEDDTMKSLKEFLPIWENKLKEKFAQLEDPYLLLDQMNKQLIELRAQKQQARQIVEQMRDNTYQFPEGLSYDAREDMEYYWQDLDISFRSNERNVNPIYLLEDRIEYTKRKIEEEERQKKKRRDSADNNNNVSKKGKKSLKAYKMKF